MMTIRSNISTKLAMKPASLVAWFGSSTNVVRVWKFNVVGESL